MITGEGSLDEQTLHGKAPAGVAAAARAAGVPVVAVAGRNLLSERAVDRRRRPEAPTRSPTSKPTCSDASTTRVRCWNGSAGRSPRMPSMAAATCNPANSGNSIDRVSQGGDNDVSQYDLVIRARRAITPTGERPAAVAVRGGTIAAIEPFDTDLRAGRTVDAGRRRGAAAGHGGHPRARQRARPHRVGGLRHRHPGRGRRRRHHDHRHAAEQPAAHRRRARAARSNGRVAAEKAYVDVGFWGGAIPGNIG